MTKRARICICMAVAALGFVADPDAGSNDSQRLNDQVPADRQNADTEAFLAFEYVDQSRRISLSITWPISPAPHAVGRINYSRSRGGQVLVSGMQSVPRDFCWAIYAKTTVANLWDGKSFSATTTTDGVTASFMSVLRGTTNRVWFHGQLVPEPLLSDDWHGTVSSEEQHNERILLIAAIQEFLLLAERFEGLLFRLDTPGEQL